MLYQYADSEDTVLLVIAGIAIAVFIVMLLVVFAMLRPERKARNASGQADEPKSSQLPASRAPTFPETTVITEGVPTEEPASASPVPTPAIFLPEAEEKPIIPASSRMLTARMFGRWSLLQQPDRSTRADLLRALGLLFGGVLVFVALLPVLIGIHERIFQALRQKGWTTYLQEFHDEEVRTLCWYFPGARQGDLLLDLNGKIWATGGCSGLAILHVFDGREWNSQAGNYRDLAAGPDGRIWAVSAAGQSVEIFDGQASQTYGLEDLGLPDHPVTRVEVDPEGRVWIITRNDQPSRTVEHIHEFTLSPQGLPSLKNSIPLDGYLNSFAPDGQGTIWVALDRSFPKAELTGVSLFDGETLQQLPGQAENHRHVAGMALDQQGHLRAVTRCGSVLKYDGNAWITIVDRDSFTRCDPNQLEGMILDNQDRVWAWNLRGVQILEENEWVYLTPENSGVAGERVFGVLIDDMDRIWIGSSGGVSMAALSDARPLPGIIVSWHRAVLYVKSWLNSWYWFLPTIIAVLWLAAYFNVLPGVVFAVVFGLLLMGAGVGIDLVNKSAHGVLVYVGVIVTLGGMLGGFVGGLIDRSQKEAGSTRWGLEMAILGMFMGFIYCIYQWWRVMAG